MAKDGGLKQGRREEFNLGPSPAWIRRTNMTNSKTFEAAFKNFGTARPSG
jgi:hypothetical protein